MRKDVIAGLDVGTSFVRVVLAGYREGDTERLSLLGFGLAPAVGMRRGAVIDPEDAARSIRLAVENAERSAGVEVDHAFVGFGGSGLGVLSARGIIAVSRADGEISEADVERAHASARTSLPQLANREIIHEIPVSYAVDRETDIKNPVGMIGTRLETQMLYVTAFTPHLRSLVRSAELAGLEVDDVVAAPLASSFATLTKHQKEIGVMGLDLGGGTASLTVFEEGTLVSAAVFPVGSGHITNDIAIGFQVPLDIAEQVKIVHATLGLNPLEKKDAVRLADFAPDINASVSKKDLAEIVEARATDIFELVDQHLRKIGRSGLLPSGAVITGGGAGLRGIAEFAKRELRLPAEVAVSRVLRGGNDSVADPSWSVAVGLCLWAEEHRPRGGFGGGAFGKKLFGRILGWLRPLIP